MISDKDRDYTNALAYLVDLRQSIIERADRFTQEKFVALSPEAQATIRIDGETMLTLDAEAWIHLANEIAEKAHEHMDDVRFDYLYSNDSLVTWANTIRSLHARYGNTYGLQLPSFLTVSEPPSQENEDE